MNSTIACPDEDKTPPLICVQDLTVAYQNDVALYKVNLDIYEGEFIGILGPNGSGKTTLLKSILGVTKPIAGSIKLHGRTQKKNSQREFLKHVGYVPQKHDIDRNFPGLVKEIVAMGLYGRNAFATRINKQGWKQVYEALDLIGMKEFANRPVGHLSGGQQQKIMIARALVTSPKVLLLDEPTANLDFKIAAEVMELVHKLHEQMGLTIVLISHNLEFLRKYSTRIIIIDHSIIWAGPPDHKELKDIVQTVFFGAKLPL